MSSQTPSVQTSNQHFASIAAPNVADERNFKSVLFLGLDDENYWHQFLTKMEKAFCRRHIILYHSRDWLDDDEHWKWRMDRLRDASAVIPIWDGKLTESLLLKYGNLCLAANCRVILRTPEEESKHDGLMINVPTDQQLIDEIVDALTLEDYESNDNEDEIADAQAPPTLEDYESNDSEEEMEFAWEPTQTRHR
jgi:hypothetical protein